MSRNQKKNRRPRTGQAGDTPVATALPTESFSDAGMKQECPAQLQLLTLSEANIRFKALPHGDDYWEAVVELAATPVERFQEVDRKDAALWLSRLSFHALVKGSEYMPFEYTAEDCQKAWSALKEIAGKAAKFHQLFEFDFYLSATACKTDLQAESLRYVAAAVKDETLAVSTLRQIRRVLVNLLLHKRSFDQPLEPEVQEVVEKYDLPQMLRDALARVAGDPRTDAEELALIPYLGHDLALRITPYPDRFNVSERIRELPSPSAEEYWAATDGRMPLTAEAWAFLIDCDSMSETADARELLASYPKDLGHPLCDGIRAVLQSFFANSEKVDVYLAKGLHLLMRFEQDGLHSLGESVLARVDGQWREVPLSHHGLKVPSAGEYLLCLGESKPFGFSRVEEASDLCSTLTAIFEYSNMENYEDITYEGVPWLCEQNLAYHTAVAGVLKGKARRFQAFVESLIRCVEEGVDRRFFYYDPAEYGEEDDLTVEQAVALMDGLERLVALHSQFGAHNEKVLVQEVVSIFRELSAVKAAWPRLIGVVRKFDPYLFFAGAQGTFLSGYLEQVAGNPSYALAHYLELLVKSGADDSSEVKNAKILWSKCTDEAQVERFMGAIEKKFSDAANADQLRVLKGLHRDAKSRFDVLNSQSQFERTAVNRWPKVTSMAMKILSVLHQIQTYRSFSELGEYAGMDEFWARKHYDRLVELGMVLVTPTGYSINPNIISHLERENQHSVVGRIIRAQGTSAVKQVFNSNREFTIYQVLVQLCPNHLVFPNSSLQSIMSFEKMKEFVNDDDFGYYLRASVDIVVVSSTTFMPLLAIEVDSVWHDTERQQRNDDKKDRLFAAAGIPFMRLRPVGQPSENIIRGQVAEHLDEMIRAVRADMPGYDQAIRLLKDLSASTG